MTERDEYWQEDLELGDGHFYQDAYTIRLLLHQDTERYLGRDELFPLTQRTGERLYFHAKPYILLPDITLRVGLYSEPRGNGIGEVEASTWEGMKHEIVGQCQGWFYPSERAAMLWESFLEERYQQQSLLEDANH